MNRQIQPFDPSQPLENLHWERFCQEYLKHCNGLRAYRAAGYKATGPSASTCAMKLLRKPYVAARIRYLQEQYTREAGVTINETLTQLRAIANSNIIDYMVSDAEGIPRVRPFDAIDRDKLTAVESIKVIETVSRQNGKETILRRKTVVKLHSKVFALDKLMKYLGLYDRGNEQKGLNLAKLFALANERRSSRKRILSNTQD